MVAPRRGKKTNPALVQVIDQLRSASRSHQAAIWRDVADRLEGPLRNWASVNVGDIAEHAGAKGIAVVAGKVLGDGEVPHAVTVGAFAFTAQARTKLQKAGGHALTLHEIVTKHPDGSGVRIMG